MSFGSFAAGLNDLAAYAAIAGLEIEEAALGGAALAVGGPIVAAVGGGVIAGATGLYGSMTSSSMEDVLQSTPSKKRTRESSFQTPEKNVRGDNNSITPKKRRINPAAQYVGQGFNSQPLWYQAKGLKRRFQKGRKKSGVFFGRREMVQSR